MPDESKEEALERRAKQAEKRRLAAIKAEEDKAKRAARKRRASNGDAEDKPEDDKSTSKKSPPKRARKGASRSPKEAEDEKEDEKNEAAIKAVTAVEKVETSDPMEEEKGEKQGDEDGNKNEKGGGDIEDEANRKPTAREKRAAVASANEGRPPVARKTQPAKYTKKPAEALTPPRPKASMKPPFGSPMPPAQVSQKGRSRVSSNNKDPPATNGAAKSAESAAPDPPTAAAAAAPAASVAAAVQAADSGNVALPRIRDFSELYAELERFEKEDDLDDYEDNSDDDDDDSDDEVDEDLRQQALQVIAERRDRERIQQMQMQAAAALKQQEEDAIASQSRRARWMWPLMISVALYYITGGNPRGWVEWLIFGTSPVANVQVCFYDSTIQGDRQAVKLSPECVANTSENSEGDETPLTEIQWVPCPSGATCQGGQLLSCPPLHEIHENWCYLSAETNETVASIQTLLHEWTVRSYCSVSGDERDADTINRDIGQWTERPFFHYSRVVGELECGYDLRLLYLGNKTFSEKKNKLVSRFVLEQEGDSNLWLALHPDIPLKIPTTCQVGRIVLGLVFLIATVLSILAWALWTAAHRGAILYYGAIVENPVIVGVATVVTTSVVASLHHSYWERLLHDQRCSAIEEAREKVYEMLKQKATSDQDAELSSSRLCQDLAWKLHEMSRQKRQEFVQHVWPCVVQNIAQDDRVVTSVRPGVCGEYWKWVEGGQ